MITTRRSFVKGLAFALGSIPLPGMVKDALGKLAPEEQTLEDAEAILRGLIARVCNGPIDLREAQLIDSFLARMEPTQEQIELANSNYGWDKTPTKEELEQRRRKMPFSVRFITGFTKGSRINESADGLGQYTPWFNHNFKVVTQKTKIIHKIVKVFNPKEAEKFA